MNTKVLLAALANTVVSFLLGWLFYGMLLKDTMASLSPGMTNTMKDPPDMLPLIVGNLAWGVLIALLFSRWAGIKTFKGGLMGGAWVAALVALSIDLTMMATTTGGPSYSGMLLDVITYTVMGAIAGGVTGYVLGTGKGA